MKPIEGEIRGYKGFMPGLTCLKKQYTCPGIFHEDEAEICVKGMHFCRKAVDCFRYYPFDPGYRVCEVIGRGMVDYGDPEEDSKVCVTDLEIVRELTWAEVLDIINIGCANTGRSNIGDINSGDFNVGSGNKRDRNVGISNQGICNVGDRNIGSYNVGSRNGGFKNVGNFNYGMSNVGDFNEASYNVGCFNTEDGEFRMFNKPSPWTRSQWNDSMAKFFLSAMPSSSTEWIMEDYMTSEDKWFHPFYEQVGGYLRTIERTNKDRQKWWDNELDDTRRRCILDIPNFDADIFKKCTGIDVRKDMLEYERRKKEHV